MGSVASVTCITDSVRADSRSHNIFDNDPLKL